MKQYTKPFFLLAFFVAMGVLLVLFHKYEQDSFFAYPVISHAEVVTLTEEKQLIATPDDLLYYQEQPIPFLRDLNTFLIPVCDSEYFTSALSCIGDGEIYLVQREPKEPENITGMESSDFLVYIIDGSSYYETLVSFVPSAVLCFQTEAFENENAYGYMNLYMPMDNEIGTYSSKSSEAKLSYETTNGLLPRMERNYTLKLTKRGEQNKLNLANLRNDDDWELDSLFDCSAQIMQFYEGWNDFCIDTGKEQFMAHYQPIDFYLDGQYMGKYLLRIPLDEKQLNHAAGSFITENEMGLAVSDNSEMEVVRNLLDSAVIDPSIQLEYYFWMEEKNDASIVHVIPRRFTKYVQADSE